MWLDQKFYLMLKADKNLKEWAEMLGDELLATTILDMLLYKCVIIQLQGKSYRLENRKPLFKEK
jgi:DNA replication protein DnaC